MKTVAFIQKFMWHPWAQESNLVDWGRRREQFEWQEDKALQVTVQTQKQVEQNVQGAGKDFATKTFYPFEQTEN